MEDLRKIYRRIRIYDDTVWELIDKLESSGEFRSFNDIINRALNLGMPKLYKQTFDYEADDDNEEERKLEQILHTLNKIKASVDEGVLNDSITHWLLSTIFNAQAIEADDGAVSSEIMNDGSLATLPRMLEEIQNAYLKKRTNKK